MLVRSNKSVIRLATYLTGAAFSSAVLADTNTVNVVPTWYLGSEFGLSYFDNGGNSGSIDSTVHRFGGGVFAGFYLNDYFGLETGLTYLGTASADYPRNSVTGSASLIGLAGTFRYELTPKLNAYAKVGSVVWFSDSSQSYGGPSFSDSGLAPLFASGLEYSFNNDFAMRVQYQYVDGIGNSDIGEFDSHFTSIGFSWRFGQKNAQMTSTVLVQPVPTTKIVEKPPLSKLEPQSEGIYFEFASSWLTDPESLLPIILMMNAHPQLTACISGHTDSSGPVSFNLILAKKRAKKVRDYLIENGIETERLIMAPISEIDSISLDRIKTRDASERRVDVLLHYFNSTIGL